MKCAGVLRRKLKVSIVSCYPHLGGTSTLIGVWAMFIRMASHCYSSVCCSITWKLQRDRYSRRLPTSSVTRVPSIDRSAICSRKSVYRSVFRCVLLCISSQSTLSARLPILLGFCCPTLLGLWSVVVHFGGVFFFFVKTCTGLHRVPWCRRFSWVIGQSMPILWGLKPGSGPTV